MECPSDHDSNVDPQCPFCAFWSAYRNSDVARHARGVKREAMMLARSLLDSIIHAAEDRPAGAQAGPAKAGDEGVKS